MFIPSSYNQSIRKCIIAFGTLFNNIELNRYDSQGNVVKKFKIPLMYSSKDRLIQRALARPDLAEDGDLQYVLPRMSFSLTSMNYDNSRKLNIIQKISSKSTQDESRNIYFSPAPYNLNFELNIISKSNDEALEIVEKIMPMFQPSFFITINVSENYEERRDISFTFRNMSYNDSFEGTFDNTRLIMYSLLFEAKSYVMSSEDKTTSIIKKVITNIFANNLSTIESKRRVTITPKATIDYNEDGVIDALDDALIDPEDPYNYLTIWNDIYG